MVVLFAGPRAALPEEKGYPPKMPGSTEKVYKKIGDVELKMYIFRPENAKPDDKRPAIAFFFGGGWSEGSPEQFLGQCKYFASRGMVAMAADYRVASRNKAKVVDCVADAKSAIRWVRQHAGELGVDPDRIVASGGSAGGHIAACTGVVPGLDEKGEDAKISSQPNAMVLFNPVPIMAPVEGKLSDPENKRLAGLKNKIGGEAETVSPYHHVRAGLPPTLIMHGKADTTVPYKMVELFAAAMTDKGNTCKLVGYENMTHAFFNGGPNFAATLKETDVFLQLLGYLKGADSVDKFVKSPDAPKGK